MNLFICLFCTPSAGRCPPLHDALYTQSNGNSAFPLND